MLIFLYLCFPHPFFIAFYLPLTWLSKFILFFYECIRLLICCLFSPSVCNISPLFLILLYHLFDSNSATIILFSFSATFFFSSRNMALQCCFFLCYNFFYNISPLFQTLGTNKFCCFNLWQELIRVDQKT